MKQSSILAKGLRKIGFFSLNDQKSLLTVRKCLPTGLADLDVISGRDINGVYGLPFGRQIEISGKPDSGKTSLLLEIGWNAQKAGHTVAWLETEHSLNRYRAECIGLDIEQLFVSTPEYLEQALKQMEKAVKLMESIDVTADPHISNEHGLVILFDSIAGTPTKAEVNVKQDKDGEDKESAMADFARRMSRFQRKFLRVAAERDALIVYSNQLKDKIGVTFGKRSVTYGGNAIRFHCAIRHEVSYTGRIKNEDGENIGMTMNVINVKNKILPPWQKVEGIELMFEDGFNEDFSLLQALVKKKKAKKIGPKYKIPFLELEFSNKPSYLKHMKEHPELIPQMLKELWKLDVDKDKKEPPVKKTRRKKKDGEEEK